MSRELGRGSLEKLVERVGGYDQNMLYKCVKFSKNRWIRLKIFKVTHHVPPPLELWLARWFRDGRFPRYSTTKSVKQPFL